MLRVFLAGHLGLNVIDPPRLRPLVSKVSIQRSPAFIAASPPSPCVLMSAWYYSQAGQAVGPFQMEVLGQLVRAGVINDGTLVRNGDEEEWQPLATVLTAGRATAPTEMAQDETRYYYLDAGDQPVGPFDLATLHRLHIEKVLSEDTLVSGVGEPEWIPAVDLLRLPTSPSSAPVRANSAATTTTGAGMYPHYLPFERYVLLTAVTLGFYAFYLVPHQSRDMKAITGRERMEFMALLILDGVLHFMG